MASICAFDSIVWRSETSVSLRTSLRTSGLRTNSLSTETPLFLGNWLGNHHLVTSESALAGPFCGLVQFWAYPVAGIPRLDSIKRIGL